MTSQEFIELIHSSKMDILWNKLANGMTKYFRTKVIGGRHIPKKGSGIIVANHSGFCGFDVVVLSHVIKENSQRQAKILAHHAYFDFFRILRMVSESFGMRKASIKNGIDVLMQDELLLIFPEAEEGNFKSSLQMYELQPFRTGFIRMAIKTRSPIIPTLVIGAEESHLNLGSIDLSAYLKNLRIPIPVNILPLPAKWQIKFLKPISMRKYKPEDADNTKLVAELAESIQAHMQVELLKMAKARKTIYV
jgi:1-acyl-sn-glycerol-3-phosphate acyltransferase